MSRKHLNMRLFLCFILLISLASCKNKDAREFNSPNKLENSDIYIGLSNANLNYNKYKGAQINTLEFEIISGSELKEDNIKIDNFSKDYYSINLTDLKQPDTLDYVHFTYNEIDWKKVYAYEATSLNKTQKKEYQDYINSYEEKIESTKSLFSPECFYYLVSITFNEELENLKFNSISFINEHMDTSIPIGEVAFMNDASEKEEIESIDFELLALAAAGVQAIPNEKGIIITENIAYKVNKDVTLIDVNIVDSDKKIIQTLVSAEQGSESFNKEFKENPLHLKTGTEGYLQFIIEDKKFQNVLDYATILKIEIITQSADGKTEKKYYNSLVQTRRSFGELIATNRDHINFESYYYDYYSKNLLLNE